MPSQKPLQRRRATRPTRRRRKNVVTRVVENRYIRRVSYEAYREKVRDIYGGPKGAILATASRLSMHLLLCERLLRDRKFDLRGAKQILDVGSGAGQLLQHVIKYADRDAEITACDLSQPMLRRARQRLKSFSPFYVTADLAGLPFADDSFDCITCGYVLEHLPNARTGLDELLRVMSPGGRLLLLTTEDNFGGAWTSRVWYCRTYNREELRETILGLGFLWKRELWFSRMHKLLRAGGICAEIEKPTS